MNDPQDPQKQARPEDAEAARLLEVGLSTGTGRPPRAAPSPVEMSEHFPDLELLEVLGQGGMGVVYMARQTKLDRLVALKVLPRELSEDPAFAERFAREARTLARLHHPHIVGVHEFGERDGLFFLVMEFVDGVTLRQIMAGGELTAREALAIVPQICDALQYAHDAGVVHRDIKPENILLDKNGRVKVADFGLAKLATRGDQDFTLTGTDQVMGTVHYMAPEQYKTPLEVDHRADIFSLGVVFYEMLTGELPVGKFQKPSEASNLDERIDEIVMRALERERDVRYQKAEEVESDVKTVVTSERAPARQDRGLRFHARLRRRDDKRPFSRFVLWSLMLLPVGVIAYILVYSFVSNNAVNNTYFYAMTASIWAGIIAASIAALVNLAAAIWASRRRSQVRGHGVAVLAMLVSLVSIGMMSSTLANLTTNMHVREFNSEFFKPYDPEAGDWGQLTVAGASAFDERRRILTSLNNTWVNYLDAISVRDPDKGGVRFTYSSEDRNKLEQMDDAEHEKLRAANALGMGVVGQATLPHSPHHFTPQAVEIDPWKREGRVTMIKAGERVFLRYPIRNDGGQWKFAIGQVTFGPE